MNQIIKDCNIHPSAKISPFVNLYGCEIGENCFIGPFVEIQKGVKIGKNTRISSHTFICEGVEIGEDCFVAHGVMFINDKYTEQRENWVLRNTIIGNRVRIGSNATILPITVGADAVIGAGSVVVKNVRMGATVYGNPAHKNEFIKRVTSVT
ncbi:MAG: UDP-3-O-(3-hydroxymyristoyl)glucosamine N-acyltransferase [Ignavibacteriaceae bacterium]|nr:MAG: UDP-3-O-(3-hydroxymyristoyl)glucosamine N-acyltransferase [Ignavibacteriaceae bacterium]